MEKVTGKVTSAGYDGSVAVLELAGQVHSERKIFKKDRLDIHLQIKGPGLEALSEQLRVLQAKKGKKAFVGRNVKILITG